MADDKDCASGVFTAFRESQQTFGESICAFCQPQALVRGAFFFRDGHPRFSRIAVVGRETEVTFYHILKASRMPKPLCVHTLRVTPPRVFELETFQHLIIRGSPPLRMILGAMAAPLSKASLRPHRESMYMDQGAVSWMIPSTYGSMLLSIGASKAPSLDQGVF
jgi:hypothetical protein